MAQRKATVFDCDVCKGTGSPDPDATKRNPLPFEWVDLTARNNEGHLFELEVCGLCFDAVMEAIRSRMPKDET